MKCEKKGCENYYAEFIHAGENTALLCPKHSREWSLYVGEREKILLAGDVFDSANAVLAAIRNSETNYTEIYNIAIVYARRATTAQLSICKELHKWIDKK